jgi:hypothetical protein
MICPKCGTVNDDANGFCINCAMPLNAQPPAGGQQPNPAPHLIYATPPAAPQRKSSRNKLIVIAVIAVVAVLIIAGIAAVAVIGTKSGNNGSIFGKVSMTASSARPYTSLESMNQPTSGNQFVMIYLNVTNGMSSDISLNPYYFKLKGSDGLSYTYAVLTDYSMATTIAAGSTAPVMIGFQMPLTVTPSSIDFSDILATHTCSSSLTSVWSTTPIVQAAQVTLTGLSYTSATSGNPYITPSAANRYINVTVTVTNLKTTSLTLSSSIFTISTSDGLTADGKYLPSFPTMPTGLQGGASVTVHIAFEISTSATPVSLEYNYFDIGTATF